MSFLDLTIRKATITDGGQDGACRAGFISEDPAVLATWYAGFCLILQSVMTGYTVTTESGQIMVGGN